MNHYDPNEVARGIQRKKAAEAQDDFDAIASKAKLARDANARTALDGKFSGSRDDAELAFLEAVVARYGDELRGWIEDLTGDTDPTPCHKDLWAQRGDPRESGL
jgi:hypothetical protein